MQFEQPWNTISIHAPHARSDGNVREYYTRYVLFQSTLLMRGATCITLGHRICILISIHAPHARSDDSMDVSASFIALFQSTLLMRGATRRNNHYLTYHGISIHAPHARSDGHAAWVCKCDCDFNPRSSCEERPDATRRCGRSTYFNPRSSCEERRTRSRVRCRC